MPVGPNYKWIALSNTTLGVLIATMDASIVIISLPAIFRGIGLDPLAPGNIGYLLWMILGYLLVSAVLVVVLGRLGDMFGRVRIYNLGFLIFACASVALSLDPFSAAWPSASTRSPRWPGSFSACWRAGCWPSSTGGRCSG
ncbi:hypothetical protein [Nonomuraea aridisoli]|uniref:hypothetical protein n=1 Tax=Nonomuraea aridisoli TaxID=2070368 RepID=UPI001C653BB8|nr:hypothetical protein [Nonomuraea aridisoli]